MVELFAKFAFIATIFGAIFGVIISLVLGVIVNDISLDSVRLGALFGAFTFPVAGVVMGLSGYFIPERVSSHNSKLYIIFITTFVGVISGGVFSLFSDLHVVLFLIWGGIMGAIIALVQND